MRRPKLYRLNFRRSLLTDAGYCGSGGAMREFFGESSSSSDAAQPSRKERGAEMMGDALCLPDDRSTKISTTRRCVLKVVRFGNLTNSLFSGSIN